MKKLLFILLTYVFLSGCSTDFEVVAPYKETMVIYGLLNPNDHVQYVRISKAYLGEGNVLIMAQQPDSIYYSDSLDVTIERYKNNALVSSHKLVKVDTIPKDAGTFSFPNQVFFAYTDSIYGDGSSYKLVAHNTKSNLVATSFTNVIANFTINNPPNNKKIDFTSVPDFYNFDLITTDNGKVYGITMKVKYTEINLITGDSIHRVFDWVLDQQLTDQSQKTLTYPFKKSQYLQLIANHVTKRADRKYTFDGIDTYITAGTEDMYTYINVTNPSYGIVQEKPVFTNINNGVGLFTCRNMRIRTIILDPKTISYLEGLYN